MTIRIVCQDCGTEKNANNFISLDINNNPVLSKTCNNCNKKKSNKVVKPVIKEKLCVKCDQTKDTSLFNKSKETKDGYNSWCKSCHADYKKQYNSDNRESINEYKRNNGFTTYAYQKKYYERRKEQSLLVPSN